MEMYGMANKNTQISNNKENNQNKNKNKNNNKMSTTNDIMMIHNQDDEIVEVVKEEPSQYTSMPPPPPPPLAILSFGNILQKFPEFLLHILSYIPDRIVWNSIASSNKKIYEKTKYEEAYQPPPPPPPWPINFKLHNVPGHHDHCCWHEELCNPIWSPNGTQIACSVTFHGNHKIIIFDQRRGLLRFHRHDDDDDDDDDNDNNDDDNDNNDDDNNNEIGWDAHILKHSYVPHLRFSPDGSFLVSASDDGFVKIWNYNSTAGYYQQLQEWNIRQESMNSTGYKRYKIDVSPCSRYVAVLSLGSDRHVFLKDIQNNGKTIESVLLHEIEWGRQIMFSSIDGHHSIFIRSYDIHSKENFIHIWRPFDGLFTILEHPYTGKNADSDFALSRDNSMIAICVMEEEYDRVMLYCIDNDNKSATKSKLTLKQSFSIRCYSSIRFTPNGKYLSYLNENGLIMFYNLITGNDITDQMNILYSNKKDHMCLNRFDFSPAGSGQRFLVQDRDRIYDGYYIASFWESSS
jgi:WD40 repeat protein